LSILLNSRREHHLVKYKNINLPVKVVYGDQDWSNKDERHRTINAIPNSTSVIIREGGHLKTEELWRILGAPGTMYKQGLTN